MSLNNREKAGLGLTVALLLIIGAATVGVGYFHNGNKSEPGSVVVIEEISRETRDSVARQKYSSKKKRGNSGKKSGRKLKSRSKKKVGKVKETRYDSRDYLTDTIPRLDKR